MAVVSFRREGSVSVVSMDNGENRHNPTFIRDFLAAMDAAEADPETHAVVIVSSDQKNWSQGIDLEWIMTAFADPARHDEIRAFLRGLNSMFTRCLTFPAPVIAAICGHCYGDGAILACACDFIMMRSDRGFFCFPEVDVNIPFMPGMHAVVQKMFPAYKLDEMYLTGRRAGGKELEEHHVAIKSCEGAEALVAEAMAFAGTFHKSRGVFGEIKRRKHAGILKVFRDVDEPIFQALKVVA
jgi:enoyl-CoA hydratase/carnithine racemase